ncbi:MAG: hypothetical protein JO041_07245 [Acidobacteria bacterium]|nr:hypothetical protein [Acidobacteriota bacterium]
MTFSERRRRTADLLLAGMPPSRIAQEMKLPLGIVINLLYNQVGQGIIRRSDILFSIDIQTRHAIETAIQSTRSDRPSVIARSLRQGGTEMNRDDLRVYLKLRDARADLGDMYEFIRDIELRLHQYVRTSLLAAYGAENWWRRGVPLPVREDCAITYERDLEPAGELYCYTTLMHIRLTFDREWPVLSASLPGRLRADKPEFLESLRRLNRIRNVVMHPVKGVRLTDDDFEFVRRLHAQLQVAEDRAEEQLARSDTSPPNPDSAPAGEAGRAA